MRTSWKLFNLHPDIVTIKENCIDMHNSFIDLSFDLPTPLICEGYQSQTFMKCRYKTLFILASSVHTWAGWYASMKKSLINFDVKYQENS